MRAVVDDRSLVELNGARPNRSSMLAWALGCRSRRSPASSSPRSPDSTSTRLTFLVVNAYAAAVFGRLVNLPRTFVGAIILGLTEAYATGYLPDNPAWLPDDVDIVRPLGLAVPIVLLFVVLVVMPGAPLRGTTVRLSRERARVPTWRSWAIGAVVLVPVVAVVSGVLDPADTIGWGRGLAYAVIMLSFVPLTGYGGQISLAQMTFAGIGAYAAAQWGAGGSPLGLVMAVLLAAVVGALVALPALRLRGIYLALATLAFAFFVDRVVFTQQALFQSASRPVDRIQLGPLDLSGDRAYLVFLAVAFVALAALVVWIRRGPFGRRLVAMKDSPAACATLGMNLTRTKLTVFALSAGIAGLGGALLAGLEGNARPSQYEALPGPPAPADGRRRWHRAGGRRLRGRCAPRLLPDRVGGDPRSRQPAPAGPGSPGHQPRPEPERHGRRGEQPHPGDPGRAPRSTRRCRRASRASSPSATSSTSASTGPSSRPTSPSSTACCTSTTWRSRPSAWGCGREPARGALGDGPIRRPHRARRRERRRRRRARSPGSSGRTARGRRRCSTSSAASSRLDAVPSCSTAPSSGTSRRTRGPTWARPDLPAARAVRVVDGPRERARGRRDPAPPVGGAHLRERSGRRGARPRGPHPPGR